MYWTGRRRDFIYRPIRWVVALLGGKVLRLTLGDATAGNFRQGTAFWENRRFHQWAKDYVQKLRSGFVLVRLRSEEEDRDRTAPSGSRQGFAAS